MTMKEEVLRDYQKPEDTEQSNRRINKALILLKPMHPLYGRFLAHYETLYRYVQNSASTMGTLTKKNFADKYGKRLEYHLQGEYVAWAVWSVTCRGISSPIFRPTKTRWATCTSHPTCVAEGRWRPRPNR